MTKAAVPACNSARHELAAAIEAFLTRQIPSDEFDRLTQRRWADPTAAHVAVTVYSFYSDTHNHPARLPKTAHDYLERLRLALLSDTDLILVTTSRRPHQAAGLATALLLLLTAWRFGFEWQLFTTYAALSLLLTPWLLYDRRTTRHQFFTVHRRTPFPTFAMLRRTRETTPTFHKIPFPAPSIPLRLRRPPSLLRDALTCLLISPLLIAARAPFSKSHPRLIATAPRHPSAKSGSPPSPSS
jgi:hypothetical protein